MKELQQIIDEVIEVTSSNVKDENFIGNQHKILAIDDDPVILNLIEKYFTDEDYSIKTALNGLDGLAMLKQEDFDLVILDLMMPDMNGYEICQKIREDFPLFELPVIILTAKSLIKDIIKAFDTGANDYISKPFDRNELIARARTLIRLKRLTKANNSLQEAVDFKNKFIQMTIHDLRNPLTIIMGLANLMKTELENGSEHGEYLNLILESSDLMLKMVNELLQTAKVESGKLFLKKEPVNLNECARKSIKNNMQRAKEKEQEIIFDPEPFDKCSISSDQMRIYEVIDNILNNAIKYSPKGELITIKIERFQYSSERNKVRVIISDKGPGFSDNDKKKLFGRFQRLSAKPTGGEPSSGLGLSVVKQLMELLDGNIRLESEPGKGSSFILEFWERSSD